MEERSRSLDSIIEQYISVVKPYVPPVYRTYETLRRCGIPEGVTNTVAIDLINTKVASIF